MKPTDRQHAQHRLRRAHRDQRGSRPAPAARGRGSADRSGRPACAAPVRPRGSGSARARAFRPRRCCPAPPASPGGGHCIRKAGSGGGRVPSRRSSCSTTGPALLPESAGQYQLDGSGQVRPAASRICSHTVSASPGLRAAKQPQVVASRPRRAGRGSMTKPIAARQSDAGCSRRVARVVKRRMISRVPSVKRPTCPGKSSAKRRSRPASGSSVSGRPSNWRGQAKPRARRAGVGGSCARGAAARAAPPPPARRRPGRAHADGAHARPSPAARARATANSAPAAIANATRADACVRERRQLRRVRVRPEQRRRAQAVAGDGEERRRADRQHGRARAQPEQRRQAAGGSSAAHSMRMPLHGASIITSSPPARR